MNIEDCEECTCNEIESCNANELTFEQETLILEQRRDK